MIALTQDFLRNEMDYTPTATNQEILFKDYYYKICSYVFKHNAFRLTPSMIDEFIEKGNCAAFPRYTSNLKTKEEREYLFMLAQGYQLIYDNNNGRNTMIKDGNSANDICRECVDNLGVIGLIQPIRW